MLLRERSDLNLQTFTPKTIRFNSQDFVDLDLELNLEAYFLGQEDNHIVTFNKKSLSTSITEKSSIPRKLTGTYKAFYLSPDDVNPPYHKEIIMSFVQIFPDGTVKSFSEKNKTVYSGWANVVNSSLIIFLQSEDVENSAFLQFIFKIKGVEPKYLVGVYSTYTRSNFSPICGREVFVKVKDIELSDQSLKLKTRRIPLYSEDFYKLEDETGISGFCATFSGPTDNYIKGLQNNFHRRDQYGVMYFHSACYIAKQYKGKLNHEIRNTIYKNLNQALIHGFDDRTLMKEETREEGVLFEFREDLEFLLLAKIQDE